VVKKFKTINSQPARNALKQEEFSWIENLMPIGNGFVPMVPGPDTAIATLASGGGGSTVTALFLNHWNGSGTTYTDEISSVTWAHSSGAAPEQTTVTPHFGLAALGFAVGGQVRATGFNGLDAEPFTLEGFASPATGGVAGLGLSSSTTSAQVGANVDDSANQVQLFVLNAAGSVVYNQVASISITPDTYKHLAIVYDHGNGTITGYYDGTLYLQVTAMDTTGYNLDRGDVGYTSGGLWDETRLVANAIYAGATLIVPTSEFSP
jgi:hypothetical protein